MLDIRLIRENPQQVESLIRSKGVEPQIPGIIDTDKSLREIKTEQESLQAERKKISKLIGEKKRNLENCDDLMAKVNEMGIAHEELHTKEKELEEKLHLLMSELPNLPFENTKQSLDPKDNECLKMVGEKPTFSFSPKNHLELNESLHLFDFPKGAKISGTGWPIYKGLGARLEWALINYMIDTHIKNGFEMWMVPLLVRKEMMYGVGQLPKFEEQLFKITDKDYSLYLIPTAEAALTGLYHDEILDEEELPKKYFSFTPCFRREAGAAGSQERGLIRTHQFHKVEMYAFAAPEQSEALFQTFIDSAEEILNGLELHYRNMLLVSGDMSFSAAKTVDMEVWLPGQNRYYEVSSISNCTDYQARRSNIRFRKKEGKPECVHTLNGSGLATSRLMIALLENNQQQDGSIVLPKALRPYLGGMEKLSPA